MRKIVLLLIPLLLLSCSKISQSDLQGTWTVDSIEAQELTSNTDSGWRQQVGALSIFVVTESMSFHRSYLVPCPSADNSFRMYDTYEGKVNYSLSRGQLIIPEQSFSYYRESDDRQEFGQATIPAVTLDMEMEGNQLLLSGSQETLDNLGNVKKRTNLKITLQKEL